MNTPEDRPEPIAPGAEGEKPAYLKWIIAFVLFALCSRWVMQARKEALAEAAANPAAVPLERSTNRLQTIAVAPSAQPREVDVVVSYDHKLQLRLEKDAAETKYLRTEQRFSLKAGEKIFLDLWDPNFRPEDLNWGVSELSGRATLEYQRVYVKAGEPQSLVGPRHVEYAGRSLGFDRKLNAQFIITARQSAEILCFLEPRR